MTTTTLFKNLPKQTADTSGTPQLIDFKLLVPDDENVRGEFDPDGQDIVELAESIADVGLIQALSVATRDDGKFTILAGNRRHAALALLVKAKRWTGPVPAMVRQAGTALDHDRLQLIENLRRRDLDVMAEARSFGRLVHVHGYSIKDLADATRQKDAYVRNRVKLLGLPSNIQTMIADKDITLAEALKLVGYPEEVLVKLSSQHRSYIVQAADRALDEYMRKQITRVLTEYGLTAVPNGYTHDTVAEKAGSWKVLLKFAKEPPAGATHFHLPSYQKCLKFQRERAKTETVNGPVEKRTIRAEGVTEEERTFLDDTVDQIEQAVGLLRKQEKDADRVLKDLALAAKPNKAQRQALTALKPLLSNGIDYPTREWATRALPTKQPLKYWELADEQLTAAVFYECPEFFGTERHVPKPLELELTYPERLDTPAIRSAVANLDRYALQRAVDDVLAPPQEDDEDDEIVDEADEEAAPCACGEPTHPGEHYEDECLWEEDVA
ncbi:MAG: ParB/RepB/Spo0J family partition protein [Rhodocyclaceae bacterium]|nr:ParB/RepB/Spo0J family partition protein [Rhodocyclaceae bacterium]